MKNATFAIAGDAIIRVDDLVAVTPFEGKGKCSVLHFENTASILIENKIVKQLRKLFIKHGKLLARDKY